VVVICETETVLRMTGTVVAGICSKFRGADTASGPVIRNVSRKS
jgi:hypothetical protein